MSNVNTRTITIPFDYSTPLDKNNLKPITLMFVQGLTGGKSNQGQDVSLANGFYYYKPKNDITLTSLQMILGIDNPPRNNGLSNNSDNSSDEEEKSSSLQNKKENAYSQFVLKFPKKADKFELITEGVLASGIIKYLIDEKIIPENKKNIFKALAYIVQDEEGNCGLLQATIPGQPLTGALGLGSDKGGATGARSAEKEVFRKYWQQWWTGCSTYHNVINIFGCDENKQVSVVDQLAAIMAVGLLIGNESFHSDNFILSENKNKKENKSLHVIDHGAAFRRYLYSLGSGYSSKESRTLRAKFSKEYLRHYRSIPGLGAAIKKFILGTVNSIDKTKFKAHIVNLLKNMPKNILDKEDWQIFIKKTGLVADKDIKKNNYFESDDFYNKLAENLTTQFIQRIAHFSEDTFFPEFTRYYNPFSKALNETLHATLDPMTKVERTFLLKNIQHPWIVLLLNPLKLIEFFITLLLGCVDLMMQCLKAWNVDAKTDDHTSLALRFKQVIKFTLLFLCTIPYLLLTVARFSIRLVASPVSRYLEESFGSRCWTSLIVSTLLFVSIVAAASLFGPALLPASIMYLLCYVNLGIATLPLTPIFIGLTSLFLDGLRCYTIKRANDAAAKLENNTNEIT